MKTDNELSLKKIIERRDPRYDGRFYYGVKTTRIYCRPVCPARPKPENILIFKSLSEAENAGFRPCKRCRPDLAPGTKFFEGTANTVSRALRLIDEENETALNIEKLSDTLGVSDRHLRRLFQEHLGASPIEVMISKRLHLAQQLVRETSAPLSEIALAVGFQSIRRFNEAFKGLYHAPPSAFRKEKTAQANQIELELMVRKPFDWKTMLEYFARHENFGIERVTDDSYQRFVTFGEKYGSFVITYSPDKSLLKVKLINIPMTEIKSVILRIKRHLDLDHNPEHLPKDKKFKGKGVRIPGSYDPFEIAVTIILGQLVSTKQAKAKQKELILKYGRKIDQDIWAFPEAKDLMNAEIETIGITRVKASAIREMARLYHSGELNLAASADIEKTKAQLHAIHGIGPWTVEIISMRCLGDSDAFPKSDLIINKALKAHMVNEEAWSSSRAYLTHILWRDYATVLSKN